MTRDTLPSKSLPDVSMVIMRCGREWWAEFAAGEVAMTISDSGLWYP